MIALLRNNSQVNGMQEMKNALISGGTSGVGLSIAKNLIASNYTVVLIGSNGLKGKLIEASLNEHYSKQVEFVQLDVSNLRDTKKITTDFISKNSKLDLLVKNTNRNCKSKQNNYWLTYNESNFIKITI
jgi:short-subunit dehydrogenase